MIYYRKFFDFFGKLGKTFMLIAISYDMYPGDIFAEPYPSDKIQLTPTVNLDLQTVGVTNLPGYTLNVPDGFSASLFADNVQHARFMAINENDVLHVASFSTRHSGYWSRSDWKDGVVYALPDADNNGRADRTLIAADDLEWPHSIAFYKNELYVADHDVIYRMQDRDGDGYYEERERFITVPGIMGRASEHITHTLVFDEINEKLFIHIGSSCDVCREDDPERATILQFNADGSGRRIYASGLRNAVGMALHPKTGQLWATNNGHDREGSALPPEFINIIRDGSFHGWPLAYAYQNWIDFTVPYYKHRILPLKAEDSTLVKTMDRPTILVDAHQAPMGIHFYAREQFPALYHNQAFVAFHFGMTSSFDPGFKVSVIFSEPDGSNATIADFVTGFRPMGTNSYWAQPMGVVTDKRGNLYISSDKNLAGIYRIHYNR